MNKAWIKSALFTFILLSQVTPSISHAGRDLESGRPACIEMTQFASGNPTDSPANPEQNEPQLTEQANQRFRTFAHACRNAIQETAQKVTWKGIGKFALVTTLAAGSGGSGYGCYLASVKATIIGLISIMQ